MASLAAVVNLVVKYISVPVATLAAFALAPVLHT
jgi:hypothetical protein